MTKINIKGVVENLVGTFLNAGKISLDLRDKGYSLRYIREQTGAGLATIQKYCSEINDQINKNHGGV